MQKIPRTAESRCGPWNCQYCTGCCTNNRPIAGISAPSHAIQDGVIVNYYESVQLVTRLKAELEEKLGTELLYGAAAIPPGVSEGSVKSIGYVLEGAGFEVTTL